MFWFLNFFSLKTLRFRVFAPTQHAQQMALRIFFCLALGLLFTVQSVQAALEAHLDRMEIQDTETVNLRIIADQQIQGVEPDLTPLQKDFDILHQGQSTAVHIVNGKQTANTTWSITLAPKRSGKLTVPSVQVGKQQTPSNVLIVRPVQKIDKDGQPILSDVLLEVSVEPSVAYVQSQLTYVIKLYHAVSLRSGSLTPPQPSNALVQKLGEDVSYETQRQNRRYRVVEQRYALFAEQSGTLEIPPVVFQGTVIDPSQRQRSRLSPLFDDMFDVGGTKSVRLRSDALSIDIKPRPNEFLGNDWLPAQAVVLQETWSDDPPTFQVGEPITRILTLQVRGLLAQQLPDIEQGLPPMLKAYPDQPKLESMLDGKTIIGQRQQSVALIATQAGTLTLPSIELAWWDTQQAKTRYARLPERQINVLPAAQTAMPATTTPLPALPAMPAQPPQPPPPAEGQTALASAGFYPWLSAALGLGWLATLLLFWFKPRTMPPAPAAQDQSAPHRRAALQAIEKACKNNQAGGARQALLAWAAASFPQQHFNHLGAVADCLAEPTAKAALADLDRHLYAQTAQKQEHWQGEVFWRKIKPSLSANATVKTAHPPLAALYPAYE